MRQANSNLWGIDSGYEDCEGRRRTTSAETRAAILEAMGVNAAEAPPLRDSVIVVRAGRRKRMPSPGEVALESGEVRPVRCMLPADLPPGYHQWIPRRGEPARLIVTPATCMLQEDLRAWGWALQLYALRSRKSWGIGDLADLKRLARWSAELGAGLLMVNPLFAATPVVPQQPSPYYPSSRRFHNPLYLRIEEVPGAGEHAAAIEPIARQAHALNHRRLIDRDGIFRLKMQALEVLFERSGRDPGFEAWRRAQGEPLERYATFCALAEHYGCSWQGWPAEYRDPRSHEVALFAAYNSQGVRFHQWVQWLLDRQLESSAAEITLMHDLPVGVDPDGADAWEWQHLLARGTTVGAPPDPYSRRGQDWRLPPFIPHNLRAAGYEPFIQTIRAALRHAGALRIDHVMGLYRLFWIPQGFEPVQGAYVRYPAEELLGIVALESRRARAFVIGEDLGTVEKGVREDLAARGILSSRLLWFEQDSPFCYPRRSVAAVTTHDLPTVAGLWTGADLRAQHEIGLPANEEGAHAMRERLKQMAGLAEDSPVCEAVERAYDALRQAPSMALLATLEDAVAAEERPNMPGTITEWPNWSLALPRPLEKIECDPLPRKLAAALSRGACR